MKPWLRRRNQHGLYFAALPGQLALIGYCRFRLNVPLLFLSHYRISDPVGNIKIMSVNPSHYRIIWADNRFRPASNREHPHDCWEGQIGPKICQIVL